MTVPGEVRCNVKPGCCPFHSRHISAETVVKLWLYLSFWFRLTLKPAFLFIGYFIKARKWQVNTYTFMRWKLGFATGFSDSQLRMKQQVTSFKWGKTNYILKNLYRRVTKSHPNPSKSSPQTAQNEPQSGQAFFKVKCWQCPCGYFFACSRIRSSCSSFALVLPDLSKSTNFATQAQNQFLLSFYTKYVCHQ